MSLATEPRTRLEDPRCPTCDAWASGVLEACTLTVPLVQDGDVFIYDHDLGEVEPCGDERDDVRVMCPNGHYWTTDRTDLAPAPVDAPRGAPLFDLGIRLLEPEGPDAPLLLLPCRCVYYLEGPEMGWQISSQCARHAAAQAALALEMFDWRDHIGHRLEVVEHTYEDGTQLCLECPACERTLLVIEGDDVMAGGGW